MTGSIAKKGVDHRVSVRNFDSEVIERVAVKFLAVGYEYHEVEPKIRSNKRRVAMRPRLAATR